VKVISNPIVRREDSTDPSELVSIRIIHEAAFGETAEAELIDQLRKHGDVLLSLIAEVAQQPVGHILFSRMFVDTADGAIPAVALAPMAVLPSHQRQGIGGSLIRRGLDLLGDAGEQAVIVLGHREYYPRFGFSCERARLLESPFPWDAYMALELTPGALEGVRGKVRYSAAFGL
jgi:putative acetyltransferase